MTKIQELALAMINYDNGDPKRIQHTTKVHAYASLIGIGEGLNESAGLLRITIHIMRQRIWITRNSSKQISL